MFELDDDEEIILEIRPHSYFLIWPIFWSIFISFLILALAIVKFNTIFWFFLILIICAAIFWAYALFAYIRFYKNRAYLTNKRLWARTQLKTFKTKVQEVDLGEIVEVGYNINGFKATIIGCGDLIIKNKAGRILIKNVPDPEGLKTEIIRIRDYHTKERHQPIKLM